MEYREALVIFLFFLALSSLPLQLILIDVMKKNNSKIELEIEKIGYGKGALGKYKAMLEVAGDCSSARWFKFGVFLERWVRILSFAGFLIVILATYFAISK